MIRKIIFIDCDGTLFDVPRGMPKVSGKSKYAIMELVKNGHLVFIASGRCKCLIPEDVASTNPTGFITANGAYAYTKDEVIFQKDLKQESVDEIINYCDKVNGVCYLESQDYIYTKDLNSPLHKRFVETWGIDSSIFTDKFNKNDKYQLMMSAFNNEDECYEFEKNLSGKIDFRKQYGFTSYDISDYGLDKGYGVKKILDYYNIDKKDAYAFGDGLNDIEMLQAVGESYAVENGNPKVKALAKNIAPDVLDDGFYQVMVWEGLIKPMED